MNMLGTYKFGKDQAWEAALRLEPRLSFRSP